MKKLSIVCVTLVGLLGGATIVAASPAAPPQEVRIVASTQARGDAYLNQARAFDASLSAVQRDALVRRAGEWGVLRNPDAVLDRAMQDVGRMLSPSQVAAFMDLIYPQLNGGGYYLRLNCAGSSVVGLLFSLVGWIGCNNDVSSLALLDSYATFIFSNSCLLTGASSCEAAVSSAYNSASGWASMIESCDVADTAYYTMAATYALCGGTW